MTGIGPRFSDEGWSDSVLVWNGVIAGVPALVRPTTPRERRLTLDRSDAGDRSPDTRDLSRGRKDPANEGEV